MLMLELSLRTGLDSFLPLRLLLYVLGVTCRADIVSKAFGAEHAMRGFLAGLRVVICSIPKHLSHIRDAIANTHGRLSCRIGALNSRREYALGWGSVYASHRYRIMPTQKRRS